VNSGTGTVIIAFIVGGVLGGALLQLLERVAVALIGGLVGYSLVWYLLGYSNVEFYQIIGFIVFACLAWVLYKDAYIILTAGVGSLIMGTAGSIIGWWYPTESGVPTIFLFIFGCIVQAGLFETTRKKKREPSSGELPRARKDKGKEDYVV
jgi:hypothetical protein